MINHPIEPAGDPPGLFRAAALRLLDDAQAQLDPADPAKSAHEVRKRIKETRTILRLLRSGPGDGTRDLHDQLRSIAHELAPLRESAALRDSADTLCKLAAELDDAQPIVDKLAEHLTSSPDSPVFTDLQARLAAAASDLLAMQLPTRKQVRRQAVRLYAKGRKLMHKAATSRSLRPRGHDDAEQWHDWRKRAKDLRYLLELLRDRSPTFAGGLAAAAKSLTDALGDEHDLAELEHEILALGRDDTEPLRQLVDRQRIQHRRLARHLGRQLYLDSPKAAKTRFKLMMSQHP